MKAQQNKAFIQKLKQKFSHIQKSNQNKEYYLTLSTTLSEFIPTITYLKFKADFILLLDICGVDNLKKEPSNTTTHRFELIYLLLNMENHFKIAIKLPLSIYDEVPSIAHLWNYANWCEIENRELFGINIQNTKGKNLYLNQSFQGYPLRKDFQSKKIIPIPSKKELPKKKIMVSSAQPEDQAEWTSIDPSHPMLNDSIRIYLLLRGEKVYTGQCEIGFIHRGFEKLSEQKNYQQIIPYTERLNYYAPSINAIAWCSLIEKAMDIPITDRTKMIRMLLIELNRISNHLRCLQTSTSYAGAIKEYDQISNLQEAFTQVMESYQGSRVMGNIPRIGGMSHDLHKDWNTEAFDLIKYIKHNIDELNLSLTRSRLWIEKMRSNPISPSNAIDWGFTGPILRACGVNYDLRKSNPFYFYEDIDFEIPLGINGNSYDRYLVRLEEIRQSLDIITQVLYNLPKQPIFEKDSPWDIHSLKEDVIFPTIPKGEWYHSIESPNGELGFFLISDGGESPYRLKVRPPSLAPCQAYPHIVNNSWYEEALTTFHSLNIVPGEIDR